ncbi:MAG: hypothetical protein KDB24_08705, partial [Microthrixaceae bacterium]|nr:hypothetical protein [Microthrixaceae bacterium]
RLVRTVLSCLGGLAAGTVGFVLLYLLPESSDPFGLVLGGALGVFVVLRLARLWWVFRRLLVALVTSDGELNEEEDGGWVKPQVEPSDYRLGKRFF